MVGRLFLCVLALVSAAAATAQPPADPLPELRPLWTITAEGCVGVHTDGEPWQECGFQSFAVNADASRILTVSVMNVIQLWDGEGRELRRIDWPDQPGGASGFPTARTAIVGNLGVTVVHQNQLAIIDISDGTILQQRIVGVMLIDDLRPYGDRIFAETRSRTWETGLIAISLPSGEVESIPDFRNSIRFGAGYYVTGDDAPYTIHFADGRPPLQSPRLCLPHTAEFCAWHDVGERTIHVLDLRDGRWMTYDTGRVLDGHAMVHLHSAGGRPYAMLCERRGELVRDCSIIDLEARQELHRFPSDEWRVDVGADERGLPEFRFRVHTDPSRHGGQRSIRGVAVDGRVREIDPTGRVRFGATDGLMLLPEGSGETSILVEPNGRQLGRLPFPYYQGWGQLVGRRWLVPVAGARAGSGDNRENNDTALAMYELPR